MFQSKPAPALEASASNLSELTRTELIKKRRSQELIIGICGAIGTGTRDLGNALDSVLKKHGYSIEVIKVTDLIAEIKKDASFKTSVSYERYNKLQEAGNDIRKNYGEDKLAAKTITRIIESREKYLSSELDEENTVTIDALKNINKVAYIVDQLKHPEEVKLLRTVYRQNFYLIGLTSDEKERENNLIEQNISSVDAKSLMNKDKRDEVEYGQQVEKTFHLSDYFIKNKQDKNSEDRLQLDVERFTKLVHGYNGVPPTTDEAGMFSAYGASLKSACLSRQVGAAIVNASGDILSTGCNDVPSFGGGLYTVDKPEDNRCIFKQGKKCHNDYHKSLLKDDFKLILDEELEKIGDQIEEAKKIFTEDYKNQLAQKLLSKTKAKDLIEYSRAIHAEMDALLQLGRTEGQTTVSTHMYTTTFPCHNCARHIVAAGVIKLIYIEPYAKSLALDLHEDAITQTGEENKVHFVAFEGVAPQRYLKFFQGFDRKGKDGRAIRIAPEESYHVDPQYLDSYFEYENKIAAQSKEQDEKISPLN